jgi:hypothetical protein
MPVFFGAEVGHQVEPGVTVHVLELAAVLVVPAPLVVLASPVLAAVARPVTRIVPLVPMGIGVAAAPVNRGRALRSEEKA